MVLTTVTTVFIKTAGNSQCQRLLLHHSVPYCTTVSLIAPLSLLLLLLHHCLYCYCYCTTVSVTVPLYHCLCYCATVPLSLLLYHCPCYCTRTTVPVPGTPYPIPITPRTPYPSTTAPITHTVYHHRVPPCTHPRARAVH